MRRVEDLEQALTDLATATAPDGVGMMEAVQADASRIRQRRRILSITAASVVVTAAMVGIPSAIPGLGQRAPDQNATTKAEVDPVRFTVDLAPSDRYLKWSYGRFGSMQFIHVTRSRYNPMPDEFVGEVVVHDPGTYDATRLLRGERVALPGRSAFFVPDLPLGAVYGYSPGPGTPPPTLREASGPALGWQDPTGAWVLLLAQSREPHPYKSEPPSVRTLKEAMVRFAESVRTTPPRDILAPFSVSYVPAGLKSHDVKILSLGDERPRESIIGFGPSGRSPQMVDLGNSGGHPLWIRARVRDRELDELTSRLGPTTRIAGYDVWYLTEETEVSIDPGEGSRLSFNHGSCYITFGVDDRERIPLSELTRMLEGARFTDCADTSTWVRPLP